MCHLRWVTMGGVIIKLGGALITDKDQIHTFRPEAVSYTHLRAHET